MAGVSIIDNVRKLGFGKTTILEGQLCRRNGIQLELFSSHSVLIISLCAFRQHLLVYGYKYFTPVYLRSKSM
jgi:hypothetical protein